MNDLDFAERILLLSNPDEREQKILGEPRLREVLPEIYRLERVPQPPDYHPEGDAFTHTLLALRHLPPTPDRRLAWAVLLHDAGKAETTRYVRGRWRAFNHDTRGAEIAETVLRRLGMEERDLFDIVWLVRHHMFALSWQTDDLDRLTRRQWRFIADNRFPLLLDLLEIDALGSGMSDEKSFQIDLYREARRISEGES